MRIEFFTAVRIPWKLAFLALLCLHGTICAAAQPLRVAIFSPGDFDVAAAVTAEVSKVPGIEVLEREQIKILLGEQSPGDSARERLALGRILAVDFLLLVEPKKNAFAWVDARSGEELSRSRQDSPGELARSASALVGKQRDAANSGATTAAVLDDGAMGAASDEIRAWLRSRGIRVLDRVLAHDVLEERASVEQGLRDKPSPLPSFPGAQFLLRLQHSGEGFRVEVLSADGSVLGLSPRWDGHDLPPDVQEFLAALLTASKREPAPTYRQRLNIEALQPFYKAVALYESGKPLEATAEFQRAYEINNLFAAAYLWEARCYEAAGLPEFAAAIRRWLETGFAGRGVAAGANASPRDGVTFLGVSAGEEKQSAAATRLSMAAIDALSGPGLLLPESLGAIRDEYDLLAATTHTEGARWETSSGFVSRFALRGTLDADSCTWVLADSLSGKPLATRQQKLPPGPSRWADDLRGWFPKFVESASEDAAPPSKRPLTVPTKDEAMEAWKKSRGAADKNVALLQLLLVDPSDPAAIGGRIAKGSDEKDGLDNYLAHAKRAALLRLLPKDHPMRPWVELDRIQTFMPWIAIGSHISGEKRDSQVDLKAFSEGHPDHPARLLARFFWLYDAQGKLPPAEVAAEAAALSKRLAGASDLPKNQTLSRMCDSMAWLGRAASGEPNMHPDKNDTVPQRFRFEMSEQGKPEVKLHDVWLVEEFRQLPLAPDEITNEAGAALAIQGRGGLTSRVDPAWMDKYPRSFSAASFIACRGIHELLYGDSRPMPFAGDYDLMRGHWRRMVDYTIDSLEYWFGKVRTPDEFRVVDYAPMYFLPALNESAFRISDEEYAAIHTRLVAASAAAAVRAGVPDKAPRIPQKNMLDWRQLTRKEAVSQGRDNPLGGSWYYYRDVASVTQNIERAAQGAFVGEHPSYHDWWQSLYEGLDECMSYRRIASGFVAPMLPKIRASFGAGSLSDDERAMLLDVGILLMWGGQFPEAEEMFSLVAEAPASVTSSERITRALRASALLHLARLQVQADDKPAAIRTLDTCLEISSGMNVRFLGRCDPNFRSEIVGPLGQRGNIRSLATRMLDELRFDPAHAVFQERCGAVRVKTRQLENSIVTIFYRLPPPSPVPPRVLVVLPSFNDGASELLDRSGPWAKFADSHNLVLVAPQFFQVHTFWRADHPCSPYHFPQLWSGETLLEGVREIGKIVRLDDAKLLFHGWGAGAMFASRFARWRPDRTGALSLHSGGSYSWGEIEDGLQANSSLKDLPVLLTVGSTDDFGADSFDRRSGAEIYNTILKGNGARVDFRLLDTTSHRSNAELQTLAEKFIAEQLKP